MKISDLPSSDGFGTRIQFSHLPPIQGIETVHPGKMQTQDTTIYSKFHRDGKEISVICISLT